MLLRLTLLALIFSPLMRAADEAPLESRIVSVGMFKNGLAVVRREVRLPAGGSFVLSDVPTPVHGTWWIESEVPIESRVTERETDAPLRAQDGVDFQTALVGKTVTIHFREGQIPPASGKVEALAERKGDDAWNRTYQQPQHYYNAYGHYPPAPSGRYLILQTDKDRLFIDPGMIAYVRAEGKEAAVKQRRPVLVLSAPKDRQQPVLARVSYLTKGLSWAPSYRVDVSDPKSLQIEQSATIKNELGDLQDAELQLISGFPSIQFGHVVSPLSTRSTLATFFQQVNQRFSPGHDIGSNVMIQQARVLDNNEAAFAPGIDAGAAKGDGVDLHYQSIGPRTLNEGDAIALQTASGKAEYERIVEWIVPDTRTANGHYIQDYQRQQEPDKYQDAAWDSVRFRNPLPFPMTTAPAMVVENGKFQGQRMSFWVNPGDETTLHVTKALSIRTRSVENEEKGERQLVWIGGDDYRKVSVAGELTIGNHRKNPAKIVIRRRFSGEIIAADEKPKTTLLEEGVYSVNPRNEATWTLTLNPGETKTLKYTYSVLVNN